jgi:hypothetical protein
MEQHGGTAPSHANPIRALVGIAAIGAALFAAYIAWLTDALMSTGDAGLHGTPLLTGQVVVAVIGLLPTGCSLEPCIAKTAHRRSFGSASESRSI